MAAKWRRRDARERILERGGGNDPPPPPPRAKSIACIREIRGGEEEEGKKRERGKIRCLSSSLCYTRRPRWKNRNGSVTQSRRVSVCIYTGRDAVVGGKHQRHVG